jgi:hypothetical protein
VTQLDFRCIRVSFDWVFHEEPKVIGLDEHPMAFATVPLLREPLEGLFMIQEAPRIFEHAYLIGTGLAVMESGSWSVFHPILQHLEVAALAGNVAPWQQREAALVRIGEWTVVFDLVLGKRATTAALQDALLHGVRVEVLSTDRNI